MDRDQLQTLLENVRKGRLSVSQALQKFRLLPYQNLGFASLDHHRAIRQGFPEVIFCEGKTKHQIIRIARELLKTGNALLATRVQPDVAHALKRVSRRAVYHEAGRIVAVPKLSSTDSAIGNIVVLTAGTSDIPVAEEAKVTAEIMGSRVQTFYDVGVAGLHRLLDRQEHLHAARVVIVVAGMDGVLPSVVGGLIDRPIVAVPTSQGYGAHFGGLAPLLTMLNACSSGIGVVNIDNGFGAGCLAHRINLLGESQTLPR
ncbi:MAG: nickel pincer cofactor biosynthesis protein LarB [Nitrospirae bacterium]|nr:MAG: nickel pincer cofactor biosynthesis protein LarB [Nitrospirota bacterium]